MGSSPLKALERILQSAKTLLIVDQGVIAYLEQRPSLETSTPNLSLTFRLTFEMKSQYLSLVPKMCTGSYDTEFNNVWCEMFAYSR